MSVTPTPTNPYVVAFSGVEVSVLIDALVAFANQCEAEGDACSVVPVADSMAHYLRELRDLDSVWAREVVRHLGMHRYENRPQG